MTESASSRRASVAFVALLAIVFIGDTARGQDYRVMSFNIRTGSANDGPNGWEFRKQLVVKTIAAFNPDFFGVQESLVYQSNYLVNNLSGYAKVGRGTLANGTGEQCAIFYKTSKFAKVRSGAYWLSAKPNVAGSVGWDAKLSRIVQWAELRDKQSGVSFVYFNTHWDHVGATARLNSATLMRQKIKELALGKPAIITGDFNADEATAPYRRMRGQDNFDTMRDFQDSYATVHPNTQASAGTAHGFDGRAGNRRIDWILADWDFEIRNAAIVRTSYNGRYPSDHFPITAVVRYRPYATR